MIEHDNTFPHTVSGELLLFRTLWNSSDDNMFIVSIDEDGEFISEASNSSLEKTFNLEVNQLDGLRLRDLLDQDTYKIVTDRYKQCIKLNKPITYNESIVLDGANERFWSTTILSVIDKENNDTKIFGISREFTKLKNIEKELKRVNDTLEIQVRERTNELTQTLEEIKKISITDALTGLYNRGKIDESLEYEIQYCKRYKEEFGLIMMDVDYFKNVNDTYGHQVGDMILVEFANILKNNIRGTDIVGRWGGEEFIVICPKANLTKTKVVAEHIRNKIESFQFSKVKDQTVSLGVTVLQDNDSLGTILKRVDEALYKSKHNGRNCITTQ